MRLFFALQFDDTQKNVFSSSIQTLQNGFRSYRRVSAENIHSTVLFLGDCVAETLPDILQHAESIAQQLKPFSLKTFRYGAFPQRKGRLVYQGLNDETHTFQDLHHQLFQDFQNPLNLVKEKRFFPHVTLFRNVLAKDVIFWKNLAAMPYAEHSLTVKSFELMESHFKPEGVTYSCVRSFVFPVPN